MELTKILVVIEPDSETQPALDKAAGLARLTQASLELMVAEFNPFLEDGYYFDPLQAQKMRYEYGEARLQELEQLAAGYRAEGLTVTATTAWANPPFQEIVSRVRDTQPDLVVKSTRHHSRVSRLFLSNEDWELVRYCTAPLLLVKDRDWPDKPAVIAAVDPDHVHDKPAALDSKIIAASQSLATATDGAVHVYHSAWVPPLSGLYPLMPDVVKESEKLSQLASDHGLASQVCHWSTDPITDSLPELVESLQAGVVVMGAVSRSRLDRLLIGNTAERLLDHLECDVLIIKPDQMPAQSQVLI